MELVIHGDVSTVENHEPGVAWSVVETKMYNNPKTVEQVRSSLAKIALPGVVNIMFDDHASPSLRAMGWEAEPFKEMMIPDVINFFVRNNSGAVNRHNPLTPWMLMHRLHHSYEITGQTLHPERKEILKTGQIIVNAENEIREILGVKPTKAATAECNFFALACTMRSARVNQLYPFYADIAAELFAQYHITGDINFQGFDKWDLKESSCQGFNFYTSKDGKFMTFFVSKGQDIRITQGQIDLIDSILDKYKPLIIDAIKYETEIMKTIPNII